MKEDIGTKVKSIDDLKIKLDVNASFCSQVSNLEKEVEEIASNMIILKEQHKIEMDQAKEKAKKDQIKLEMEIQRLMACRFLDHIKIENAVKQKTSLTNEIEENTHQIQQLEEQHNQRNAEFEEEM